MSMILSILLVVVVFTLMMPDTSLCSRRPLNVVAFGDTGFDLAPGKVDGGVLYMSNWVRTLQSMPDVNVTVLSRECRSLLQPYAFVSPRAALYKGVPFVHMDDERFETARRHSECVRVDSCSDICRTRDLHYDNLCALLRNVLRELAPDVLLYRSQHLMLPPASARGNQSRVHMRALNVQPCVDEMLEREDEFAGWAWIIRMNSFYFANDSFANGFLYNGQRLLLQEPNQAKRIQAAIGDEQLASNVAWAPPLAPGIPDLGRRVKKHPRNTGPVHVCFIGAISPNNKWLNDDLLLGFARARRILGDRVDLFMVEVGDPSFHNIDVTEALLRGVNHITYVIPHEEALRYYADYCHVGVRGSHPSIEGSFATKMVEMAAYGIPTIVSPSLVNFEVFGRDYPYYWPWEGSVPALANLIVRVVKDPDEYERTSLAMSQIAAGALSQQSLVDRLQPWVDAARRKRHSVALVIGVRPNLVKAAPLIAAMHRAHGVFNVHLVHTGQHTADTMSGQLFVDLNMPPPVAELTPPPRNATREEQIAHMQSLLVDVFVARRVQHVLVLGDVTSTVAASRAARQLSLTVMHYEGGLRCFDDTVPEELNRVQSDELTDVFYVTEPSARKYLLAEGYAADRIVSVGNLMVDSLVRTGQLQPTDAASRPFPHDYVLITTHRQHNVNTREALLNVVASVTAVADAGHHVMFVVHPRTRDKMDRLGVKFDPHERLSLHRELRYAEFVAAMRAAKAVVTDSGGVQEETSYWGIPCVTLRPNTERPVTVDNGTNVLASIQQPADVVAKLEAQIARFSDRSRAPRIALWDGKAAQRMVAHMTKFFDDKLA